MKKSIVLGVSMIALFTAVAAVRPGKLIISRDNSISEVDVPAYKSSASIKLLPTQRDEVASWLKMAKQIPLSVDGSVELPFSEDFADGLGGFTVIDANADGVTWTASGGMIRTNAKDGVGDDWLISPGFNFEEGRNYSLSFTLKAYSSTYNERIEVKCGQGVTADDMTTVILEPTDVKDYTNRNTGPVTVNLEFTAPATGVFNVGIRSYGGVPYGTDEARYYDYVDDFMLDALALPVAPAMIDDLQVIVGERGELSAVISFTAPNNAVDETPLTSIDKIELLRNGDVIKTFDTVNPGDALNYVDTAPIPGLNTYSVIAYNVAGKGTPGETTVFIGIDIPAKVTESLYDDSSSSLKAVWQPVVNGENNGYIDPASLTYIVGEYVEPDNWWEDMTINILGETSAGVTTFDFGINPDEGEQDFVEYIIAAKSSLGIGEYEYISPTTLKVTGAPYALPFDETFANLSMQNRFWAMLLEDPYTSNGFYISSKDSYDNENGSGCLSWIPIFDNENAALFTGKISLADTSNPVLFSAVKGNSGSTAKVTVSAQLVDGSIVPLRTVDFSVDGSGVWMPLQIPLAEFKDNKYVHIKYSINGNSNDGAVMIDDIHIIDLIDVNPSISVELPPVAISGEMNIINVKVTNRGRLPINDYNVVVKVGDNAIFDEIVESELLLSAKYDSSLPTCCK